MYYPLIHTNNLVRALSDIILINLIMLFIFVISFFLKIAILIFFLPLPKYLINDNNYKWLY